MAATLFTDVKFDLDIFKEYMEELSPEPAAFIRSGIIRKDPSIQITEGNLVSVPFYKPLTGSSQVYGGADLTVNSIGSGIQNAIVLGRANVWGSQDLAAELASKDPMKSIASKVAQYWEEEWQRTLLVQLNGIFKAASMATHVHNVATEDGDNATAEHLMGSDVIIDAIQTSLGDNGTKIKAMSVHSAVYARLQKLKLIEYVSLADQNILVPTFLGKEIIVDDAHTVVAGTTSGKKYTSYLFAEGAIGEAEGSVKVPTALTRDELAGGGTERLVNRYRRVYHMYGTSFAGSLGANATLDDTALAVGTNWTKVYEDKNIPVISVVTNG